MSTPIYRAWDTGHKKMWSPEEMGYDQEALLPDGRGFANISSISTRLTEIHSHLVPLQFTTQLDKNRVRIFEDDIVKRDGYYRVRWIEDGWWLLNGTTQFRLSHYPHEEYEVVGNYYENPELLDKPEI